MMYSLPAAFEGFFFLTVEVEATPWAIPYGSKRGKYVGVVLGSSGPQDQEGCYILSCGGLSFLSEQGLFDGLPLESNDSHGRLFYL